MRMIRALALLATLVAAAGVAVMLFGDRPQTQAQSVSIIGPVTVGHCVSFFSPVSIQDSGGACGGGGGSGTVTSVGLALPASLFSITNSPVTVSGTLTGSFVSQTANQVFAAPSGSSGVPTFRALVAADVPAISLTTGVSGVLPAANGGTGAATLATGALLTGNGTSALGTIAPTTSGRLLVDQGASWLPKVISGDVSMAATGVATVGSFNGGTAFGTAASGSFAAPGPIGGTTASTGAFTTLTASTALTTADLTVTGPITVAVRVTTTSPVTISNTTDYLLCNRQAGATATTINLPASHNVGDTYVVKDCKGDDSTNNITVTPAGSDAIDAGTGGASYVMKNSSASATPVFFDRAAFTWSGSSTIGWIVN